MPDATSLTAPGNLGWIDKGYVGAKRKATRPQSRPAGKASGHDLSGIIAP
ncbi:MAG: hypothetical protein QM682_10580 [Paracoccus sp. (in: a-proteobacteria)]